MDETEVNLWAAVRNRTFKPHLGIASFIIESSTSILTLVSHTFSVEILVRQKYAQRTKNNVDRDSTGR